MGNIRRKKGSGTLLERNGKFVLRWFEGGKLKQESTGLAVNKTNRPKAEALLAEKTERERLLERNEQITLLLLEKQTNTEKIERLKNIADGKEALTLGGLVDAFRASPRRKDCGDKQLDRYCAQIAQFVSWAKADGMEFAAVDDDIAERYAAELGKQSGSTYNKHLNTLTMTWKALGKANGVKANPWADIPRKRLEAHVRRALTAEEIAAILAAAEGEYKALITIGYRTGLRMGDACRLRWADFKKDGSLVVKTSKTGALVALPAETLLAELKAILGTPKGEYVLPEISARYARDPAGVSDWVCRYFARAGLTTNVKEKGWSKARPDATYHSLRHTFVTRLTEAGVPSAVVRALVGHSTVQMQEHYTHVSADAVLAALRQAKL